MSDVKASVWTRYGPPEEVFQLQEVERPSPRDNEVLVRVHAASINSWDWELTQGVGSITLGRRGRPPFYYSSPHSQPGLLSTHCP